MKLNKTSALLSVTIILLSHTSLLHARNEYSAIEDMYNRSAIPSYVKDKTLLARKVVENDDSFEFTFANSDTIILIKKTDVLEIMEKGEGGYLFRTRIDEYSYIQVKGV